MLLIFYMFVHILVKKLIFKGFYAEQLRVVVEKSVQKFLNDKMTN